MLIELFGSCAVIIVLLMQYKQYNNAKNRAKFKNGSLQEFTSEKENSDNKTVDREPKPEDGNKKTGTVKHLPIPRLPVYTTVKTFITSGWKFSEIYRYLANLSPIVALSGFGGRSVVVINDYDLSKEAFFNPKFNGKVSTGAWVAHSNGKYGVMSTSGKVWEEQRKFCKRQLKQFGFGTKSMEPLIQTEICAFLDLLERSRGQPFSPNKLFYTPVLNPLWWILVGERFANEDAKIYKLVMTTFHAMNRCLRFPAVILLFMTSLSLFSIECISWCIPKVFPKEFSSILRFQRLRTYFKELIDDRKKSLNASDTPRDFLEAYLLEMMNCTNSESGFFQHNGEMNLLGVMADFFIAGGDTTANELTWSLLHLIRHPDIQREIQIEIDAVVGQDRLPQLQDRPHCPLTEAFLEEVLRMNPVALSSLPHETLANAKVGPYFIPKGSTVFANIIGINYDPEIWGDPENFRPTRFLHKSDDSESLTFVRHEAMASFSIGRRRCLGEQLARDNMFLFVSSICQRFTLDMLNPKKLTPLLEEANSAVHTPAKYYLNVRERQISTMA